MVAVLHRTAGGGINHGVSHTANGCNSIKMGVNSPQGVRYGVNGRRGDKWLKLLKGLKSLKMV